MLHYAVIFFIIAIIAAVLGFGGIAGASAGIAKVLFIVFLVIAAVMVLAAVLGAIGAQLRRLFYARVILSAGGGQKELMELTCLKSYPAGLGHRGLSDKRVQGDHLTPEGRYYLCVRNAQSAFHLFLGISYPGEAAAERGLKAGLITKTQHSIDLLREKRAALITAAVTGKIDVRNAA